MSLEKLRTAWPLSREAILFALIALANTAAYVVVAMLLIYWGGMPAFLASGIAYVVAVIVSFLGNALFTFEYGRWNSPRQWLAFGALYSFGLAWNVSAVHLFDKLMGSPFTGLAAFAVTWPVLAFLVSKLLVFRAEPPHGRSPRS